MDKPVSHIELTNEIKLLIETTKQKVSQSINSSLTLLYWSIGHLLNNSLKKEYGEEIVATVSQQLQKVYGKGIAPCSSVPYCFARQKATRVKTPSST